MRIENNGDAFIIRQIIVLVLFNLLGLSESIACDRRKLLCLLMFIREDSFSPLIIADCRASL